MRVSEISLILFGGIFVGCGGTTSGGEPSEVTAGRGNGTAVGGANAGQSSYTVGGSLGGGGASGTPTSRFAFCGSPPTSTDGLCLSSSDCANAPAYRCVLPGNAMAVCGTCQNPQKTCALDGDCSPGGICVEYTPTCACTAGTSTQCQAGCGASNPCPSGERCNASSRCEATPCTEDYTCGDAQRCTPASALADAHGCEPLPCSSGGYICPENTRCIGEPSSSTDHGCRKLGCAVDADCDCGMCISGQCETGPGYCSPLAP